MSQAKLLFCALASIVLAALWWGRPGAIEGSRSPAALEGKDILISHTSSPTAPQRSFSPHIPGVKAPFFTEEERNKKLNEFKREHSQRLHEIFAPFWLQIQASEEVQKSAVDLLVDRELQLFSQSIAPENGVVAGPPDAQKIAEVQSITNLKLEQILGSQNAESFKQFQRTLPQRRMVKQFNRLSGNSLPAQTQDQILAIAIEESSKVTVPPGEFTREQVSQILLDQAVKKNDAILSRASAILEPEHLQALQQTLQADVQRFNRRAR